MSLVPRPASLLCTRKARRVPVPSAKKHGRHHNKAGTVLVCRSLVLLLTGNQSSLGQPCLHEILANLFIGTVLEERNSFFFLHEIQRVQLLNLCKKRRITVRNSHPKTTTPFFPKRRSSHLEKRSLHNRAKN